MWNTREIFGHCETSVREKGEEKMEEVLELRMHELGPAYACRKCRSFRPGIRRPKDDSYRRAAIVQETLRKILFDGVTREAAEAHIKREVRELEMHEIERETFAYDTIRELYRYIKYENEPLIAAVASDVFVRDNMLIHVTPTFLKADMDKKEVCISEKKDMRKKLIDGSIEIVKVRTGKPVPQRSAETDIGLWAMLKYGRSFIRPGEKIHIKASYYFLRRSDDSFSKGVFKDFDEKNIVSITEVYEDKPNEMDEQFDKVTEEFLKGTDSSEMKLSDCEKCIFFGICRDYEESPEEIRQPIFRRSLDDICFTKAQQMAMEY